MVKFDLVEIKDRYQVVFVPVDVLQKNWRKFTELEKIVRSDFLRVGKVVEIREESMVRNYFSDLKDHPQNKFFALASTHNRTHATDGIAIVSAETFTYQGRQIPHLYVDKLAKNIQSRQHNAAAAVLLGLIEYFTHSTPDMIVSLRAFSKSNAKGQKNTEYYNRFGIEFCKTGKTWQNYDQNRLLSIAHTQGVHLNSQDVSVYLFNTFNPATKETIEALDGLALSLAMRDKTVFEVTKKETIQKESYLKKVAHAY